MQNSRKCLYIVLPPTQMLQGDRADSSVFRNEKNPVPVFQS